MKYKTACPNCGTKMSRWYLFGEPTFKHRCRSCGVYYKAALAASWITGTIAIGVAVGCLILFLQRIISKEVAIGSVVLLLVLFIWLLPYFLPTRLASPTKTQSDDAPKK